METKVKIKGQCNEMVIWFVWQVVMQLIKHCHEMDAGNFGIAQGALLGLVENTKLEITHSFPFTSPSEEAVESDEDYQVS